MKDTFVLKNGTVIELEAGASLSALQVLAADRAAMVATWEQLTDTNLSEAQVKNGDGTVVGNYTDLTLVSETSVVRQDGSILTIYHLREKTSEERRLDALEEGYRVLEEGQEVQDGAINDVATLAGQLAQTGGVA